MIPAKSQRARYYPHYVRYRTPDSLSANPLAKALPETQSGLRQNPFRRQIRGLQKGV
jgi:hypothetical protein